jgi:S-adenosylmethionine/arginine decarboxylase-like enzyme
MNPELLHRHMIVRAEILQPIVDCDILKEWLESLISDMGMKILLGPYVTYCDKEGNRGITGIVAIETSSIMLHIWDECNPGIFQFDVYTCSELYPDMIIDHLKIFQPTKIEYKFIDRASKLEILESNVHE